MIKNLVGTLETIDYKTENKIQLYHNCASAAYPLHRHTGMEMILILSGTYTVTVGSKTLSMKEQDILLIPPGELHMIAAPDLPGERLICQFDYAFLLNNSEMLSLLHLLRPCRYISALDFPALSDQLSQSLLQIEKEYFEAAPFYETRLHGLLSLLFVSLGRSQINFAEKSLSPAGKQQKDAELFMSVCQFITTHYMNELTLEEAAAYAGFSKSHFCKFFKNNAGKSFYDYLQGIRISRANILLQSPDSSVTDIAFTCGFKSIATFNRVFRQYHNCSPTEYREMAPVKHSDTPSHKLC